MRAWSTCLGLILAIALTPVDAARGVPPITHFQGQVLDADGNPVAGPADIEVSIWDRAAGGALLYREAHDGTALTNGVFQVILGSNDPSVGALDAALFSGDDRWLEVSIDGDTLAPRLPFSSVPYAFHAEEAERAQETESVAGIDASDIVSTSGATFTGPIQLVGGNGSANVRIGSAPGRPGHGSVSVADAAGSDLALLFVDPSGAGRLALRDVEGNELAAVGSQPVETERRGTSLPVGGYVGVSGPNGSRNAAMGGVPNDANRGQVSVFDERGRALGIMYVDATGSGSIQLNDAAEQRRVALFGSLGAIAAFDPTGKPIAEMRSDPGTGGVVSVFRADSAVAAAGMRVDGGAGHVAAIGPNGGEIVRLSRATGDANRGRVAVRDGNSRADRVIAEADGQGTGVIGVLDERNAVRALVSGSGGVSVLGANGNPSASLIGLDDPPGGSAVVSDANGELRAALVSSAAGGSALVLNAAGDEGASMSVTDAGAGVLETFGPNGSSNVLLSSLGANANHGLVSVRNAESMSVAQILADASGNGALQIADANGHLAAAMQVAGAGNGFVATRGPNGSENVRLGSPIGSPDLGSISVANSLGETRGLLEVLPVGAGHLTLLGPNGSDNVRLTALTQNANHGFISVHDASGAAKAMMLVDPNGKGRIIADIKNFVVDHPDQPGKKIVYAALEGPEAAMYHRGVVALADGRATIEVPEHFAALAVAETITVQLTPRSLDSLGVAVDAVDAERIEVAELHDGRGSYDVHFLVHAVRRGFEDYQPVVTVEEFAAGVIGVAAEGSAQGRQAPPDPATTAAANLRPLPMAEARRAESARGAVAAIARGQTTIDAVGARRMR